MRKLYALFENEKKAQNAIDKISDIDSDIKIEIFADNISAPEEDVFLRETHIIGSPWSMASQFQSHESDATFNITHQAGLSAFCFADFVATSKNSLIESKKNTINIPIDSYGAGLLIKTPSAKKTSVEKALFSEGAKLID